MVGNFKIVISFAILLLAAAVSSDVFSSENDEKDLVLSANKLYNEYLINEMASDLIYKGEEVELHGIVYETDSGDSGVNSISLWTDKDGSIQCFYPGSDKSKVLGLRKGLFVTVRGKCAGKVGRNIILRNCSLE